MRHHRGLETLAVAGHGASILIHVLGAIFNWIEARTWRDRDVLIHGVGIAYSAISLARHVGRISHNDSQETSLQTHLGLSNSA